LDNSTKNLFLFTLLNTIWSSVFGLIGPFYVIHFEKLSFEKLGIAFGIMVFFQAFSSYLAGRFSDRIGRKPFLFLAGYVDSLIIFLYTVIKSNFQLYVLQGIFGITNGIAQTMSTSLLGDITTRERRGRSVGIFNAFVGISSSAGLFLSSYIAELYGIKTIFYIASASMFLSTFLLFGIKEDIVFDNKVRNKDNSNS